MFIMIIALTGCNKPKGFYIHNSTPEHVQAEILRAAEVWNKALGYEVFIYQGLTHKEYSNQIFGNGSNVVYYDYDFNFKNGTYTGVTLHKINTLNDKVYNWDIVLNASKHESKLYGTILHELGHALGLSHSDNISDIMHAEYQADKSVLTTNDIERAKAL